MKRLIVIFFFSVTAFASVMAFTLGNANQIKKDMTEKQVTDIMGKPDKKANTGIVDGKTVAVWKFGEHTEVTFIDGKVSEVLSTNLGPK